MSQIYALHMALLSHIEIDRNQTGAKIFVYKKKTNINTLCIQIMYTVFLVVHLSDFFDG